MSLVGAVSGQLNKATNLITSGLTSNLEPVLEPDDFRDGLLIQEILSSGDEGQKVVLIGNMMPHIPLKFGGSQRIKKEFYSGYSEPTMQVFGPEEDDITINGELKDKRYKDKSLKGVATEMQQLLDEIRIRGNVVRFKLGEMERYGILHKTSFEMDRLTKVKYSITFSIIGFTAPKNAIFLETTREFPFGTNKDLIAKATEFQTTYSNIPKSVPLSIGDQLRRLISDVATVMASITDFVDSIVRTVEDIRKSIERAKGMIKFAQNKLRSYKRMVGSFQPFNSNQTLTGRYESAKFYSGMGSALSFLSQLLNKLRKQLGSISNTLPLGRHFTKDGDNLQKISVKFYGTADHWKKIYDYNNLASTQLEIGRLLEIPRL
jgi:hypothetical protein